MNRFSKVLFWIFTIGVSFANPAIGFALIVLYYLPGIIQGLCRSCKEGCNQADNHSEEYFTEDFITYEENGNRTTVRKNQVPPKMDSYSDDTLEDMK